MNKLHLLIATFGLIATAAFAQNTFPATLTVGAVSSGEPTSLKLDGGATAGIQIRVGDNYSGAFGTRYSGADTFLSSNSYQNSIGADSWTKGVSTYGSTAAIFGIDPSPTSPAFQLKYSPANTANGSMGSFFASNLFTVLVNGNVGIGTTSPTAKLHVIGDIKMGGDSDSRGLNLSQDYLCLGETENAATTILGNNIEVVNGMSNKLRVSTSGADGSNWVGINYFHGITFNHIPATPIGTPIDENSGELMRIATNGNVGIGTTSPSHKLSVNGTVRAREVIVESTGWSDYVFADDYRLASLAEVESHIKAKKHLPGVPSATEVAEKGVSVGDMQAVLLAKIEELTLHQIAQEKEQSLQHAKLEVQAAKIAALEAENAQLKQ